MNTLKIAHICCTHPHASAQIAALAACEELKAIVLCDADAAEAEKVRATVSDRVQTAVSDLDAVMNSSEICAVSVTAALRDAPEIVTRAARAGKHIFCEPSISPDAAALGSVLEEVRRRGVVVQPNLWHRHRPDVMELRRQVELGRIGAFRNIELRAVFEKPQEQWFLDSQLCGGLLNSIFAGFFDLAEWLPGAAVQSVSARLNEDYASLTLGYGNGAIGTFNFGWLPKKSDPDVAIVVRGTEGIVSLDPGDNSDHATVKIDAPRHTRDIQFQHGGQLKRDLEARVQCARGFIATIANSQPVPDGTKALMRIRRLLDACAASRPSGNLVPVEP